MLIIKEIHIRFKTQAEISQSKYSFPFIITIDGIEQEKIKRFSIDINAENENIEANTYTIEKYMDYPENTIS